MRGNGATLLRSRPTEILYVEDNPAEVELWCDAASDLPACSVHTVHDGAQAREYLRHTGPYADLPHPDLILLDVSLPYVGGHRVLAEVKGDSALRSIPVIVMSTSALQEEITRAYELGANAYVVKPAQLNEFRDMVRAIHDFWCIVSASPNEGLGGVR